MIMEANGDHLETLFDGPGDDGGGSTWQPVPDA